VIKIFHCYGLFHEGLEDVQDNPKIGHLSESQTDGNIKKVQQRLLQNHHLHFE
jgi:hypothetical protein